ncbi:MAG: helix-hairpin-helix domain-containing protein [Thomasclavelia sp.]|nr:helix-hairpin-helix domain-containing protein [Thomasclavelia sp.]
MKIKEIGLLFFFFIISTVYAYSTPSDSIENIQVNKNIEITVEGKIDTTLSFDHTPSVKEVFKSLKINNYYGFNEDLLLEAGSYIYIPVKDNLISLNTASIDELMSIKGIGKVTASKIIEYRCSNGFDVIEDIKKVDGIGDKTYQKLRIYFSCKK